jgi:hypothetical protein
VHRRSDSSWFLSHHTARFLRAVKSDNPPVKSGRHSVTFMRYAMDQSIHLLRDHGVGTLVRQKVGPQPILCHFIKAIFQLRSQACVPLRNDTILCSVPGIPGNVFTDRGNVNKNTEHCLSQYRSLKHHGAEEYFDSIFNSLIRWRYRVMFLKVILRVRICLPVHGNCGLNHCVLRLCGKHRN